MPNFDDIFEHGQLAKEFNITYKSSPEYEELICIFEEEHPKLFKSLKDIDSVVKPIVVGGMLKKHYDTIELLKTNPRAADIVERDVIKWMEEELEEVLDNKFRIFNHKTGLHYNI